MRQRDIQHYGIVKTELVYCPRCHRFEQVGVVPQGYLCLECRLIYSRVDSEAALEKAKKEVHDGVSNHCNTR